MQENTDTHIFIVARVENSAHEIYNCLMPNGNSIIGRLSGKLRFNKIQILPGDYIQIRVSANDLSHGHITRRYNDSEGKRIFNSAR